MKIQIFKDILKSKTDKGEIKYSQGRVYLFVFILCYILSLGYLMFFPKPSMQTIIDALQWAILVFVAYVFGGKGVDATKHVFKIKSDIASNAKNGVSTVVKEVTKDVEEMNKDLNKKV